MPRKSTKKSEIEEEVISKTPINDVEEIDFVEYISEPNIKLGTDFRKKIKVTLDGKTMSLAIRPLSQNEIMSLQQSADMGQGTFAELVVATAGYSLDGKKNVPLPIIEDKIPAGVVVSISDEVLKFSGYGLPDEAVDDLKKP